MAVLESLCLAFFDDIRIPVDEAPVLTAPRVMEQMSLYGEEPADEAEYPGNPDMGFPASRSAGGRDDGRGDPGRIPAIDEG